MSYLPYEGYSYYVDSFNTYHFNVIVPYSSYNYRVEVLSPVEPLIEETVNIPEISLTDVKNWVTSFEGLIDDENSLLYPLFILTRDIAQQIIRYELCGSIAMYKRAIAYYIAHYMELHFKLVKDEEDRMSLSPQKKNEAESDDFKKFTMVDNTFGNYKQTIWGQMFWAIYGNLAKFDIGYMPY